jgi:hypothetical protein
MSWRQWRWGGREQRWCRWRGRGESGTGREAGAAPGEREIEGGGGNRRQGGGGGVWGGHPLFVPSEGDGQGEVGGGGCIEGAGSGTNWETQLPTSTTEDDSVRPVAVL